MRSQDQLLGENTPTAETEVPSTVPTSTTGYPTANPTAETGVPSAQPVCESTITSSSTANWPTANTIAPTANPTIATTVSPTATTNSTSLTEYQYEPATTPSSTAEYLNAQTTTSTSISTKTFTPLSLPKAVINNDIELVELLLNDGITDPAETDNHAIKMAIKHDNLPIFKLLLADKRVNQVENNDGRHRIIAWAALNGRFEMLKLLLDNGRVEDLTANNNRAIDDASMRSHVEIVEFLMARAIDLNANLYAHINIDLMAKRVSDRIKRQVSGSTEHGNDLTYYFIKSITERKDQILEMANHSSDIKLIKKVHKNNVIPAINTLLSLTNPDDADHTNTAITTNRRIPNGRPALPLDAVKRIICYAFPYLSNKLLYNISSKEDLIIISEANSAPKALTWIKSCEEKQAEKAKENSQTGWAGKVGEKPEIPEARIFRRGVGCTLF
jgi:hypothetical protein